MCVQMSSGRDGARLLIMKLQITKSNYSPISSQKILCPELPSPPLYLAFSLSSIPRFFFFFFLHFSLSLCLSFSPPCFASSSGRCSRQNDITTLAGGLQHSKTQCIRTVCACVRERAWDQHPGHGDPLQRTTQRIITCKRDRLCACVCVCERGRNRHREAWMGRYEGRKSTLTVFKLFVSSFLKTVFRCCASAEGLKMSVITSWHSLSLHLKWVWAQTVPPSVSLHWLLQDYLQILRCNHRNLSDISFCRSNMENNLPFSI